MAVDLKVRDLELVILLSETLNEHVVADTLGMSQPGVSKRLQELERHVRVRLFDRHHSKISITSRGRHFVKHARKSVESYRLAMIEAQTCLDQEEPSFRVGISPDLDIDLVSVLHAINLPLFPDLRLECNTDFCCELVDALLDKRLEIALVISPPQTGKTNLVSVRRSSFRIAMRAKHPLAWRESIHLEDIGNYPWIFFNRRSHPLLHDRIIRKTTDRGLGHLISHSIFHADEALSYLPNSDAIAWLAPQGASRLASEDVCVLPLEDDDLNLETFIATRADDRSALTSEFVRSFMKKLKVISQRAA